MTRNKNTHFIWISLVFPRRSLLCFRISPHPHDIWSPSLLSLLWSVRSQTFLVVHDLNSFEEYWSSVCRTSFYVICLMVFLMVRLGLWHLGKTIAEMKYPSHHTIPGVPGVPAINMAYHYGVNIDHLTKVRSAIFLPCSVPSPQPSESTLGKQVTQVSPHPKRQGQDEALTPGGEYLCNYC